MCGLVRDAVADGAVGLSTGLIYVPGIFSRDRRGRRARGARPPRSAGCTPRTSAARAGTCSRAIGEALEIGERAGLPVHVSHLKCESARVWGERGGAAQRRCTAHRTRRATSTPTRPGTPRSRRCCRRGRRSADIASIAAADGARLRAAVEVGEPGFQSSVDGVGWDRIVLVTAPRPSWQGQHLAAVARGSRPGAVRGVRRAARDRSRDQLHRARDGGGGRAGDRGRSGRLRRLRRVGDRPRRPGRRPPGAPARLRHVPPGAGDGAGGAAAARGDGPQDDRPAGRSASVCAIEGPSRPARSRTSSCSIPRPIRDTATYDAPHTYPDGLSCVVVNGTVAWEPGTAAIARAGRALRR